MKITDIAFNAYAVSDVDRAIKFYRDVLGLKPGKYFNERSSAGVNFEVDDVAGAREHLLKHNVTVSDVYDFPSCSVCFAIDPDGNNFALHQRKDAS